MKKTIKPGILQGSFTAPSSKSMLIRFIVGSMLAKGTGTGYCNTNFCDDVSAAIRCAEGFGASFNFNENMMTIEGNFRKRHNVNNCGESGLTLKMFSVLATLIDREIFIEAEGSLLYRSVEDLVKTLKERKVFIRADRDYPPLIVCGPLPPGQYTVDGSKGSQLLSGLLFALPTVQGNSNIQVKELKSKPYIDLTLDLLQKFGIEIQNNDYQEFIVPGNQKYKPIEMDIEGDWSGAAMLLTGAAISGEVTAKGLLAESFQADKAILDALRLAGAAVSISSTEISVKKADLKAFSFDATDCPDLFPPLLVLAANCDGTSKIHGVSRLHNKESNRALVLKEELEKMGASINIVDDTMHIKGKKLHGAYLQSRGDHRMAMTFAIAALNADSPVTIGYSECVSKSYPAFFDDIEKLRK